MTEVTFKKWTLLAEVRATQEAYRQIEQGSPEGCGCSHCLNFAAARDQLYPVPVRHLFEQLGIDPTKEAEIYHLTRLETGLHLYGGWFHFIGQIESGPDARVAAGPGIHTFELVPVDKGFEIGFTNDSALASQPFENHRLVQLEFTARIPWVLQELKEPLE